MGDLQQGLASSFKMLLKTKTLEDCYFQELQQSEEKEISTFEIKIYSLLQRTKVKLNEWCIETNPAPAAQLQLYI